MEDVKTLGILMAVAALIIFAGYVLIMSVVPQSLSPSKLKAVSAYTDLVYQQLLQGSANNPGLPVALAQLVTAQSQWESANYTSDVFQKASNAFGYTYDSGSQYQVGNYNGYGMYGSLNDSVLEIIDYIYRRVADGSFPALSTITTPDQYATLLKNAGPGAYYTAPESQYSAGIASYMNQDVFNQIVQAAGNSSISSIVLIAGIGIGIYYLFK